MLSFSEGIDYPCPSVKSVVSTAVSGVSRSGESRWLGRSRRRQIKVSLFALLAPFCGHFICRGGLTSRWFTAVGGLFAGSAGEGAATSWSFAGTSRPLAVLAGWLRVIPRLMLVVPGWLRAVPGSLLVVPGLLAAAAGLFEGGAGEDAATSWSFTGISWLLPAPARWMRVVPGKMRMVPGFLLVIPGLLAAVAGLSAGTSWRIGGTSWWFNEVGRRRS
jgi:hypothetical protein